MVNNSVSGVTRREEYADIRPTPTGLIGNLAPVHAARQTNIGEDQAD